MKALKFVESRKSLTQNDSGYHDDHEFKESSAVAKPEALHLLDDNSRSSSGLTLSASSGALHNESTNNDRDHKLKTGSSTPNIIFETESKKSVMAKMLKGGYVTQNQELSTSTPSVFIYEPKSMAANTLSGGYVTQTQIQDHSDSIQAAYSDDALISPVTSDDDGVNFEFGTSTDQESEQEEKMESDTSQGLSAVSFYFKGSHVTAEDDQSISFSPPVFPSLGSQDISNGFRDECSDNLATGETRKFGNITVVKAANGYVVPIDELNKGHVITF